MNEDIGTICAIDPGSVKLGFCVMRYDVFTLELKSISAETFFSSVLGNPDSDIALIYGERVERIMAMQANLERQFEMYQPNVICSESPYFNSKTPGAFGPLTEMLWCVRQAAMNYRSLMCFHTYEPSPIKKAVGAKYSDKKLAIKLAVLGHKEIIPVYEQTASVSIFDLDDNAIDAIAVAYTHLQHLRSLKNVQTTYTQR